MAEPGSSPLLYEDHVVDAVCGHLEANGWVIESRAYATQTGDDIVAVRDGMRLRVEAKGGGSSKESSSRFGKPFTYGQCQINVGQAVLRSLRVVSGDAPDEAAVAVPDTPDYRRTVEPILAALRRAPVRVFLVQPDRAVLEI